MDEYEEEYGPADLGDVTMGKLIDKHQNTPQSKGLASLLKLGPQMEVGPRVRSTKKIETITTELQNFDPMVMNEILRVVREKNLTMEKRFDQIESQLKLIDYRPPQKNKNYLYAMLGSLVLGVLIGSVSFNSKKVPIQRAEVPAVIPNQVPSPKQEKMVTTKFVNLRNKNSPKAQKIITIAPAQIVEILERKKGWAYVSYHNKLSGKVIKGHLWDEYLTHVK